MLLFCISAVTYSQKTDVQDDELNGKVKSVTLTRFSQDPGEERRFGTKSFTSYNEKGFMLEYSGFESERGPIDFSIIPCYDKKGRRNLDSNFNEGRIYSGKSTYSFDKLGNKIEWVEYRNDDTVLLRHLFKYNSRNHLIKHLIYNSDELSGTVEYILDTKGRVLNEIYTFADGNVWSQNSYLYDLKGNAISKQYKNPDKKKEYFLKMKYDDFGNVVLEEEYDSNGVLKEKKIISYSYDKHNNWIDKSITRISNNDKSSFEMYEMEYRVITYY